MDRAARCMQLGMGHRRAVGFERTVGVGTWEGSRSGRCRDNEHTHTHRHSRTPGSTSMCTPSSPHRPPRTPVHAYVAHIPISLSQLRMSIHTHHTRSHTQSSSTPTCRWACADAQAGYMHLCAHASLHTHVVGHTCTHTCSPPHMGR